MLRITMLSAYIRCAIAIEVKESELRMARRCRETAMATRSLQAADS